MVFIQGFIYGIKMTLTNPLTILFWSGTLGSLITSGKLTGIAGSFLFSVGCILSTVYFLLAASIAGNSLTGILSTKLLKKLDYVVGAFLIYYSLQMLVNSK
ncbi:MAG: LysE family translocator [Clostridia bacterium]|nr:LysE family translocator [Clostridia bacterium]